MDTSTPSYSEFNPHHIAYQWELIKLIKAKNAYDYELGFLEVLLSGAVGSAKSLVVAHLAVNHCLEFPGARVGISRRSLPDLKRTIYLKCKEHIVNDESIPDSYYFASDSTGGITFGNGSSLIPISWADGRSEKVRSLELSALVVEEATENKNKKDRNTLHELKARVGRLPHIPESWIIYLTNPDGPSHWVYDYFNLGDPENRKDTMRVFYSKTRDNPFLPKSYADQLERDYDPLMARRMIQGEWIEIDGEGVYHTYSRERNFSKQKYIINPSYPVFISWDFNIAEGKPMSLCMFQFIKDHIHIFDEVIVHGIRTLDTCEELVSKGYLDRDLKFIITGDATGKHRDTRSKRSDYDIIKQFFANYQKKDKTKIPKVLFDTKIFSSNEPIRTRHNTVNAYCMNAKNQVRLTVYSTASGCDKGLMRTKLKEGSYIEDDSYEFQHVTTAIGYGLRAAISSNRKKPTGSFHQ